MDYQSKYLLNKFSLIDEGWSEEEIEKYLPVIENLSSESLLELHSLCGIQMFRTNEKIDNEQAINVLIKSSDTPKDVLFAALSKLG